MPTRRLLLKSLLSALVPLTLTLNACKKEAAFNNVDISEKNYGQGLALPDQNGQIRSLQDFPNQVTAVFFGYTHCPDICPTTLIDLRALAEQLGADRNKLQVVFVTLDPQRDTPELLKEYVQAFGVDFLGLRGTPEQTAQAAKSFNVFFEKKAGSSPENYLINHSAGIFLLDTKGRTRLLVRQGETIERMAQDIRLLLAQK